MPDEKARKNARENTDTIQKIVAAIIDGRELEMTSEEILDTVCERLRERGFNV
jgi:hypothetical protein